MKEKEDEILKLMKRVNSLSDNEEMLSRLEKSQEKNVRLKKMLCESEHSHQRITTELEEGRGQMYSNMDILQKRIVELEKMNDVLILLVGENAAKITQYEEQLGISPDSTTSEEGEEDG